MAAGTAAHAKIASGQTVSSEVDLRGGYMAYAVQTPAAFTGVTLAFQVAEKPAAEGGVYGAVFHMSTLAATATVITGVTTSQVIVLNDFFPQGLGNCMVRLVSGSAEAADRDLTIHLTRL